MKFIAVVGRNNSQASYWIHIGVDPKTLVVNNKTEIVYENGDTYFIVNSIHDLHGMNIDEYMILEGARDREDYKELIRELEYRKK